MSTAKSWSPEDDKTLIRLLVTEHRTRDEAAAALGRSPDACRNRLHRLRYGDQSHTFQVGGAGMPWTSDEVAILRTMLKGGKNDRAIAAELGRSVASVKDKRRTLRLLRRDAAPASAAGAGKVWTKPLRETPKPRCQLGKARPTIEHVRAATVAHGGLIAAHPSEQQDRDAGIMMLAAWLAVQEKRNAA